jgi:hypothetical protein
MHFANITALKKTDSAKLPIWKKLFHEESCSHLGTRKFISRRWTPLPRRQNGEGEIAFGGLSRLFPPAPDDAANPCDDSVEPETDDAGVTLDVDTARDVSAMNERRGAEAHEGLSLTRHSDRLGKEVTSVLDRYRIDPI